MAHGEQRHFVGTVRERFPGYFTGRRVLDVGSLNINGTVRDLFADCEYVGADLEPGPGVDVVGQGQELDYPDRHFDVSISCECFEHNPYWLETFVNMHRMTSGLVVFTCASEGRGEHGTSRTNAADSPFTVKRGWEYYRNLVREDFSDVLDLDGMFSEHEFSGHATSHDLYFWGLVR